MSGGFWTLVWVLRCTVTVSPGKYAAFTVQGEDSSPQLVVIKMDLAVSLFDLL